MSRSIVWIRDLVKLNLNWWFDFWLKPFFDTAPAASKNPTHFKNGQSIKSDSNLTS